MRFALMVLGYKEPSVLRRALPIYKQAGFDTFVHLDAKVDQEAYIEQLGETATLCIFVEPRISVFWAGFSMVEAELALINAAMANNTYDRYTLVSDDTFPIASADRIRTVLSEDLDRVMLRKLEKDDPFYKRYERYYYFDHPGTSVTGRAIESAEVDDQFLKEMLIINQMKQFGKSDIDIYYGSQWWSLTATSLDLVMHKIKRDKHLMYSFKYSAVPDEIMFQTLLGNLVPHSKFRSTVICIDWSKDVRPFIYRRWQDVIAVPADFLFIRKVASDSTEIFDRAEALN